MKRNFNAVILAAGAVLVLSFAGAPALAQHEQHGGQKPAPKQEQKPGQQQQHQGHDMAGMDMSKMMQEPHLLLAMAHHESMAAFAKILSQHAGQTGAFNADFARDAVAEIRRNFDQVTRHHQEHMEAMSAAMRSQMDAMMKQMEPHQAKVKEQLEALERETGMEKPDRARITQHAAELIKHLGMMSGMHGGHAGHSK